MRFSWSPYMPAMTIQHPSPSGPEMPDKPSKPGPEMPDKPRKPDPQIEQPHRARQPETREIKKRPDEPFQKPEIDIPGPNLPTPDNPEGRDVGYRPPGSGDK